MTRYVLTSSVAHFFLVLVLFIFAFTHRPSPIIWLEGSGFDFRGGGGDGRPKGGGLKPEQKGQIVPQPEPIKVPAKPAPIQTAQKTDETWAVKTDKDKKDSTLKAATDRENLPLGDKETRDQTNIVRRGVSGTEEGAGEGFDGGEGTGLGIGVGPGGGGFGFGSYLSIMRKRIWSEWTQITVLGTDKFCIVGLTVAKNGQVSHITLDKTSGDPIFDNTAQRAVRNSSPLPPLPPGFLKSEQRFRIKFRLLEG